MFNTFNLTLILNSIVGTVVEEGALDAFNDSD